jgi:hypothetical protein
MKANPVILTKKVVQKAGAGKSYSSPITPTVAASTPKTKTKPAMLGQRYATSFLISLELTRHLPLHLFQTPILLVMSGETALVLSKLEACVLS